MSSGKGVELEKFVLRLPKEESGSSGVLDTSIVRFVMNEASDVFEKKYLGYDVSYDEWRKVAADLEDKGFSISVTEYYGKDRKKIDFSACSYDKKVLQGYVSQKIGEAEKEIMQDYREVNQALKELDNCKQALEASSYPTYSSGNVEKLKNLYGKTMVDLASKFLNLDLNFPERRVKVSRRQHTGYDGKSSGKFILMLMNSPKRRSDLYDTPEGIRELLENAPTGASGQRDSKVPSRACDVLAVDLLHETGHIVADLIAEASHKSRGEQVPDSYQHSKLYKQEFGSSNAEKAANELAAAAAGGLAGNLGGGVFREVRKGLQAYLKLTKWDNPAEGYRSQHPIKGSRSEIKKLFS